MKSQEWKSTSTETQLLALQMAPLCWDVKWLPSLIFMLIKSLFTNVGIDLFNNTALILELTVFSKFLSLMLGVVGFHGSVSALCEKSRRLSFISYVWAVFAYLICDAKMNSVEFCWIKINIYAKSNPASMRAFRWRGKGTFTGNDCSFTHAVGCSDGLLRAPADFIYSLSGLCPIFTHYPQ